MGKLLSWFVTSKTVRIGSSVAGGAGVLTLILSLNSTVNAKVDKAEVRTKRYAELIIEPVKVEIAHLKEKVKETNEMVKDIHNYLLKNQ